jgi:hypothetical protein
MPRGSAPGERRGGRARGTPNKVTLEVKALASQHGPQAIQELARLAGLVEDGKGKAESEQAQIAALNGILDRGYGKPTQAIVGDPKRPVVAVVTVDRPPEETREQWLARRGRELAANTAVGAAATTVNGRDHR